MPLPTGLEHTDIPQEYFLTKNTNSLTFSETRTDDTVFARIENPDIYSAIYSHIAPNTKAKPLKICIKAFTLRHITREDRDHLCETGINLFYKHYKKQGLILAAFAKNLLKNINSLNISETMVIAWTPAEYGFVFAAKTSIEFGRGHKHVLCTLYPDEDHLVIGTIYTIPQHTFNLIKKGNERYLPLFGKSPLPLPKEVPTVKVSIPTITNNNNNDGEVLVNAVQALNIQPSSEGESSYNLMDQKLSNIDPFENSPSYAENFLMGAIEENAYTSTIISKNEKFSRQIFDILSRRIDTIQQLNDNLNNFIEQASLILDRIGTDLKNIEKHYRNYSFNILKNYNSIFTLIGNNKTVYTSYSNTFAMELRLLIKQGRKVEKIWLTNHPVEQEQPLARELASINKQTDAMASARNDLREIINKIDEQALLLGCAYLKNIFAFLIDATDPKCDLRISTQNEHYKLFINFYNSRDTNLEPTCKAANQEKLFKLFVMKAEVFLKTYKHPESTNVNGGP